MSEAGRRQWWQGFAVLILVASAAAGAWVGFISPSITPPIRTSTAKTQPREPKPWVKLTTPPATSAPVQTAPELKTPAGLSSNLPHPPVPHPPVPNVATPNPDAVPIPPIRAVTSEILPAVATTQPNQLPIPPAPITTTPPQPQDSLAVNLPKTPAGLAELPTSAQPGKLTAEQPSSLPLIPGPVAPSQSPQPHPLPSAPTPLPHKPTEPPVVPPIPVAEKPIEPPLLPKISTPATALSDPPPMKIVPNLPIPPIGPITPPKENLDPPTSPIKLPEMPHLVQPIKPESGLLGGIQGNTVKSETMSGESGLSVPNPTAIPAPEALKPAIPTPLPQSPDVPLVGSVPNLVETDRQSGTVVDRPKPPALPLPSSERDTFPIPDLVIPTHPVMTPGENVMTKCSVAAAAILGSMLAVQTPPVSTAAPVVPSPALPKSNPTDDKIEIAELKKQVEDSNKKLDAIQAQLKQLNELLNGRRDDKGLRLESDPGLVEELKRLKDKLAKVDEDLAKMKSQTALRPTTVDPRAGKGTVRIVNEYPVQVSIVVNGTSYRVAPSKTLDVDVPAGEFTYQLLEAGAASTKSIIKERETVTLRIK